MSDTIKMATGQCVTCGRQLVQSWVGNCINCYHDKRVRELETQQAKEAERSTPIQVSTQLEVVCKALEPLDTESRSRVLRAAAVLFAIPGGLGGGR